MGCTTKGITCKAPKALMELKNNPFPFQSVRLMDQKGYQIHQAWLCVLKSKVKHIWGSPVEESRCKFPSKTSHFHKHPTPVWWGGLKKLLLFLSMRIARLGWAPLIKTVSCKSSSIGLCILYQEREEAKGCKTSELGFYTLIWDTSIFTRCKVEVSTSETWCTLNQQRFCFSSLPLSHSTKAT